MRTIKFRGKILGINGWVYGYFYHCVLPKGDAFMILTEDHVEIDRTIAPKHHLAFSLFQDMFLVEGETVGQFTGLKDKNGTELYEGDIFRLNDHHIRYVVEYEEGVFHGKQIGSSSYVGLPYWLKDVVIVGNKYDNPELLKQ